MLNSDVYWITCEMDVTCDLLCWITMILACMLVGLKSLVISLNYRGYMGSSARIWSLRWLFLHLCSYNLDGFVTFLVWIEIWVLPKSCTHLNYNYSHTYELEYSLFVMILTYELVYSLYVMRLAYMTLCLIIHITHIIGIRAKLRWQFIVPLGVPKSFTCRSIGSESRGIWVGSVYTSVVLGYGETGECIVLFYGWGVGSSWW
jgi:hypothetical protein